MRRLGDVCANQRVVVPVALVAAGLVFLLVPLGLFGRVILAIWAWTAVFALATAGMWLDMRDRP